MPEERKPAPRRKLKTLRLALWVLVAFVAALLVLVWAVGVKQFSEMGRAAEPYGTPFQLVDQNGAPIDETAMQQGPSAVFFGFTHCPDVCPTTLYELSGYQKTLAEKGKNLKIFFVSIDPERDTPGVIKAYVSGMGGDITGITGAPEAVREMAKGWGAYFQRVETGDTYTMDHTASVFLLGPNGQFVESLAYQEKPETALEQLDRLFNL